MIAFYYLISWLLWGLCAPFLLAISLFSKKHKRSFKARFFLWQNARQAPADVHFHCCSYGEVKAVSHFAGDFNSRFSVVTQTGFDEAKKFIKSVNFLPFENLLPLWFSPCKVLVVFEAELWLMLFFVAKKQGAKTMLINARISEKSFAKYQKFTLLYKKIFSYIDEIYAQSVADKERLEKIGAKNVQVVGNIKAKVAVKVSKKFTKPKAKLIVFASTHEGEEALLLGHFILKKGEKLVIAPRHPERFEKAFEIACEYATRQGLSCEKFSKLKLDDFGLKREFSSDILILDTLGELVNFYAIADVVALCGSFIDGIGGHNPVEIATFGTPLISGVFIHNQKALFANVGGVGFCDDLSNFEKMINSQKTKTFLKNDIDISPILQGIQGGIDARKGV